MRSPELTIGFTPVARTTFDIPLAGETSRRMRAALEDAGFTVVGGDTLITTPDEARAAANDLSAAPLDALLIFHATFVDSTLCTTLVDAADAPPVLWAIPEAPTGERLRANALCGIMLSGHALRRAGCVYGRLRHAG